MVFSEAFDSRAKIERDWQASENASHGQEYEIVRKNGNSVLSLSGFTYFVRERKGFPAILSTRSYFLHDFLETSFRLKMERGGVDFYFRCNPDYGWYLIHFENTHVTLSRFQMDRQQVMATCELAPLQDRWVTVIVRDDNGRISVDLNKEPIVSVHDDTPLRPGRIQFGTAGKSTRCFIDDISVLNTDPDLKTHYSVEIDVQNGQGNRKKIEECVTLWTLDGGTLPFASDGPMAARLKSLDFKYLRIRAIGDEGWLGGGVTVRKDAHGKLKIDFSHLDETVNRIHDMGMSPFMRLGWEMPRDLVDPGCKALDNYWTCPPADYADWEELVYQIVRHYNVDNDAGIKWWVVWNEPDIEEFGGDEKSGLRNPEDYCKLYQASVNGALRADPSIMIGGPGIAGSCGNGPLFGESCFWRPEGERNTSKEFLDQFLTFCSKNGVRLDFLLFHKYRFFHPKYYVQLVEEMNALAHSHGLAPEMVLDEWTLWEVPQNEKTAAYVAASIQYFQKTDLELACYTSFNGFTSEDAFLDGYPEGIGLAMINGRVVKPPYFAFQMYSMLGDTLLTAAIDHHSDISEDDSIGGVAASDFRAVQVLIWRYDDLYRLSKTLEIRLQHLETKFPGITRYRVKGYLIDRHHTNAYNDYVIKKMDNRGGLFNLETAELEQSISFERDLEDGQLRLSAQLEGYAVLLIVVEPVGPGAS